MMWLLKPRGFHHAGTSERHVCLQPCMGAWRERAAEEPMQDPAQVKAQDDVTGEDSTVRGAQPAPH